MAYSSRSSNGRTAPRGFFLLFGVVGLLVIGFTALYPLTMSLAALTWKRTPCRVLSSEVHRVPGKGSGTFRIQISYEYFFHGERLAGSRYSFDLGASFMRSWKERVVAENRPGQEAVCYVDPRHPEQSVFNRDPTREIFCGVFGLPFAAVGLLAFPNLRWPRRRVPRERTEDFVRPEEPPLRQG